MGLDRTRYAGTGIALVRVVMGLMLFYSGLTKLMALGGVVGFFGMMRIPAPEILAPVIAAGEVVGGLLLVLGLGIRFVSVWFIAQFLVTTFYVKLPGAPPMGGFDASRIDIMLLAGNIMLLLEGAGTYALDTYLTKRRAAEGQPQPARA